MPIILAHTLFLEKQESKSKKFIFLVNFSVRNVFPKLFLL
jgi:hypothetical protein